MISYFVSKLMLLMINMESNLTFNIKRNIVEESVEKQECWEFTDIECKVDKKNTFKHNILFEEFQSKEF